jgi:hypothetical protein
VKSSIFPSFLCRKLSDTSMFTWPRLISVSPIVLSVGYGQGCERDGVQ